MEEVWKDVQGYEGYYKVSSFGRVKSIQRTITYSDDRVRSYPEVLLIQKVLNGYWAVGLNKKGVNNVRRVHVLVADAFLKKEPHHQNVNHIDGVKSNNYLSNLERCTVKENSQHAYRLGLIKMPNIRGLNNGRTKLTNDQVIEIRSLCKLNTYAYVSKIYGISATHCSYIVKRKNWTHI